MSAEQNRGERLQKVLAHAGVASRRKSEEYIEAGRVQVNGETVTELGTRVDPEADEITVDGKPIRPEVAHRYYLLYKPPGYLSTVRDPHGRPIVLDLVPNRTRLYPVGRLDLDSEGLLLLTNDGALTQRLTHPRYEHEKQYLVLVQGTPPPEAIKALQQGIEIDEDKRPAKARVQVKPSDWRWRSEPIPEGARWITMALHEGRKRQIRRMLGAVGGQTLRLIRVRMGPLRLGDLKRGEGRWLSPHEVETLRRSVGLGSNRPHNTPGRSARS